MKRNDSILREAKQIIKWNKKRFNRKYRRTGNPLIGKGCQYKKNSYDARLKTMT